MSTITNVYELRGYGFAFLYEVLLEVSLCVIHGHCSRGVGITLLQFLKLVKAKFQ